VVYHEWGLLHMEKNLILIRHGHRDNSRRELDNGLDEKGKTQAKNIRRFFLKRFEDQEGGIWIASSPKRRCTETVLPLALDMKLPIDVHPGLDEQAPGESGEKFQSRVQKFLRGWIEEGPGITVACSHGDWIPVAVYHLLGVQSDPKKGSWTEVTWSGGRATLKWYLPTFKQFFTD
jgi:broad specificity phosphatase PhoE